MTIHTSLHNPIVKTLPDAIYFQRCVLSVGRSSAFPCSSDVPESCGSNVPRAKLQHRTPISILIILPVCKWHTWVSAQRSPTTHVVSYMIRGRIEKQLDKTQPEEQHGFRAKYRIEEHLLTANLVIDKTVATGKPVWIVNLDLSKAFVHWGSLWQALRQHEVSDHMVWILQCLYHDQIGTVRGSSGTSRPFDIRQGVRQGCVLSPRLFACVLQWALRTWRARVEHYGLDFEDGMAPLLDLRFADDLLLLTASQEELIFMLGELIGRSWLGFECI